MHGFWRAAEAGLDDWAAAHPADADGGRLAAPPPRRLFAADLAALGAAPRRRAPELPAVPGTDDGPRPAVRARGLDAGRHVHRPAPARPARPRPASGLRAFSPYGAETGAMWHAFRRSPATGSPAAGTPTGVVGAARRPSVRSPRGAAAPPADTAAPRVNGAAADHAHRCLAGTRRAGRPDQLRAGADPRPRQHPAPRRAARGQRTRLVVRQVSHNLADAGRDGPGTTPSAGRWARWSAPCPPRRSPGRPAPSATCASATRSS